MARTNPQEATSGGNWREPFFSVRWRLKNVLGNDSGWQGHFT